MTSAWKPSHHLPRFVKIIILTQAAIILSFTVGMYQEYLSNAYLQQYVISLFTSNIVPDAALSIVTASIFALGTFTLLGSMSTKRRERDEWRKLSEFEEAAAEMPVMPVLETVEPGPRTTVKSRRSRTRRPRIDNNDLYRSMTRHATEREQQPWGPTKESA